MFGKIKPWGTVTHILMPVVMIIYTGVISLF